MDEVTEWPMFRPDMTLREWLLTDIARDMFLAAERCRAERA